MCSGGELFEKVAALKGGHFTEQVNKYITLFDSVKNVAVD
jgi:hypothetical protein